MLAVYYKVKNTPTIWPSNGIPTSLINRNESKIHPKMYVEMPTSALLIQVKLETAQCPPTVKWINCVRFKEWNTSQKNEQYIDTLNNLNAFGNHNNDQKKQDGNEDTPITFDLRNTQRRSTLICCDINNISGFLGQDNRMGIDCEEAEGNSYFWGNGNFFYLNCDGGYIYTSFVKTCQTLFKMNAFYCMHILPQ